MAFLFTGTSVHDFPWSVIQRCVCMLRTKSWTFPPISQWDQMTKVWPLLVADSIICRSVECSPHWKLNNLARNCGWMWFSVLSFIAWNSCLYFLFFFKDVGFGENTWAWFVLFLSPQMLLVKVKVTKYSPNSSPGCVLEQPHAERIKLIVIRPFSSL